MKKLILSIVFAGVMVMTPVIGLANYTLLSGAGTYWKAPVTGDPSLPPYTGGVPVSFNFDSFDTYSLDSSVFTGAGTINFGGSSGWVGVVLSDHITTASGNSTSSITWDYLFAGISPTYPMVFDINYFFIGNFVGHEQYSINGYSGPYVGGFDLTKYDPVPLPPSLILLASGLLSLFYFRLGYESKT
jgi:hypothetical protein